MLTLLAHLTCTFEPHRRQEDPGLVIPHIDDYRKVKLRPVSTAICTRFIGKANSHLATIAGRRDGERGLFKVVRFLSSLVVCSI